MHKTVNTANPSWKLRYNQWHELDKEMLLQVGHAINLRCILYSHILVFNVLYCKCVVHYDIDDIPCIYLLACPWALGCKGFLWHNQTYVICWTFRINQLEIEVIYMLSKHLRIQILSMTSQQPSCDPLGEALQPTHVFSVTTSYHPQLSKCRAEHPQ